MAWLPYRAPVCVLGSDYRRRVGSRKYAKRVSPNGLPSDISVQLRGRDESFVTHGNVEIIAFNMAAAAILMAWLAAGLGATGAHGHGWQERSVRDGVYTQEQAKRGEMLYATYCANCHGAELAAVTWRQD